MPQSPIDQSSLPSLFQNSQLQWTPLNKSLTRVEAFRRMINHKHGLRLKDYHDLHKYSVEDYTFWNDLWDFLGIISSVPPDPTKIITPGTHLPFVPNWFPDVRMNYAENVLARGDIDGIAITAAREFTYASPDPKQTNIQHYSWRQLRAMVREMAAALKVLGVGVGDRIAAIVTNAIEGAVIALATASIGAIFSSTAPDMGTQGILDRYRQITPKIIFAETEVFYAGKTTHLVDRVAEVARDLDGMKGSQLLRVVLLKSTLTGKKDSSALHKIPKSTWFEGFLATGDNRPLTFEQLPFSHPLVILYSSGTTGAPKCIVHSAGGCLIQQKKDAIAQFGMGHDDTYFQFTTTGWMMWSFMLGTLSIGMRVIAYDGSPFHPDPKAFLKFVSDQRVTLWGVGPRLLTEIWGRGIKPHDVAPFDSLRILMSTGAVLTPPMFRWAQESFGSEVHIASSTGGTDVCASLASGVPSLPVYSGEIQGKSLGIKLEVFDHSGVNIEHTGEAGEMVVTRPHVSLPLYFWGDDEKGTKYWKAYYETYNGIWRQGDFMAINPETRGIVVVGRSDGVLNPSGIRFGSAEIYSVLESFCSTPEEGVEDTLCIGQRRPDIDDDERVLLFVKMRKGSGKSLTKNLEMRMKERIAKDLSRRHVPAYIFEVEDIPVTVNMKKIEIAVKQIVSGYNLKPSGTVANPDALKLYHKYRDIENLVGLKEKKSRSAQTEKAKPKL